jgi:anaerobic ribonucleoside-triphosphate reductase
LVSQPHRSRGVKVLKAVSSPLRLQLLNLLFDKSALSYTELMNSLKMNPSRDAGRFAYHLKFLLKAELVEADVEAKKYYLTDLGKMVLDVADRVEKKAVTQKGMIVRTSHFTLEEFDANKIANSLIKEAKVPSELAQKAAKEAEKRLLKSKTKYLTASLIREVVNGILIEKGYEDYRHKLTRVGMPIHEVTSLIETKDSSQGPTSILTKAGQTVLGEYTLLNIFPRDIADAHLSGAIHIGGLGTWILKPSEAIHDLRFFLQNGLKLDNQLLKLSIEPPQTFQSALAVALNVFLHASREVNNQQIYSYFNTFLSPYAKGVSREELKENLRLFILSVNQHAEATLSLDLSTPKHVAEKAAVAPQASGGKYQDYAAESRLLAELTLEVYAEASVAKPLFNPKLIIKISCDALADEAAQRTLLKAHVLAANMGSIYFVNLTKKGSECCAYSTSAIKLSPDLTGDWETDTLRTGCLGYVTINLPKIVMESDKDKNKFFEALKERFELAARALGIKYSLLKQYGKNSLPFMLKNVNGDTYFRLESCSRIINFAGFEEAVESFTGQPLTAQDSIRFISELVETIVSCKQKMGRKHGKRLFPALIGSMEASERLAQLDIEKYGVAKIKFSGNREKPYYKTSKRWILKIGETAIAPETIAYMQKLSPLNVAGTLDIIELELNQYSPEKLLDLTKHLIEKMQTEIFTYNHAISYCDTCKKIHFGTPHKCPSCGSISNLMVYDRFSLT